MRLSEQGVNGTVGVFDLTVLHAARQDGSCLIRVGPKQRRVSALRDGGPGAAAGSSVAVIAWIILLALIAAAIGGG